MISVVAVGVAMAMKNDVQKYTPTEAYLMKRREGGRKPHGNGSPCRASTASRVGAIVSPFNHVNRMRAGCFSDRWCSRGVALQNRKMFCPIESHRTFRKPGIHALAISHLGGILTPILTGRPVCLLCVELAQGDCRRFHAAQTTGNTGENPGRTSRCELPRKGL